MLKLLKALNPIYFLSLALALLLVSGVSNSKFAFIQAHPFWREFSIMCLLAAGSLIYIKRSWPAALLLATFSAALYGFFSAANGNLLFSDDHPSFMYRLMQLKDHFPHIPFYNTAWNAGADAREFFPSGALGLYFLTWPLLYLSDVPAIYNLICIYLIFVIPPLSLYLASAALGLDQRARCIAATLALGNSLLWYRFALTYGTLGFLLSAALAPLLLCLIIKGVEQEKRLSSVELIALFILGIVVPRWAPITLLFFPAIIYLLIKYKKIIKNKTFLSLVLIIIALNLPLFAILAKFSNVATFVAGNFQTTETTLEQKKSTEEPKAEIARPSTYKAHRVGFFGAILHALKQFAKAANPLIVISALFSIFWQRSQLLRISIFWLAFWSALGSAIIPRLELERMFLPVGLLVIFPLAELLARCTTEFYVNKKRKELIALILPVAFLFYTPLWIWKVSSSRTVEKVHFAGPEVESISDEIKRNAGDGRVLFAGFILHEFNHGHIAPLPKLSGKSLIASRYQHDRWGYEDIMPEWFRKRKDAGVHEYLNLMNVSLVVAHETFWREWFKARPELFQEIWKFGRFIMFKRIGYEPNPIIEGNGYVEKEFEDRVILHTNSEDLVIKYTYFPFLEAQGCQVLPAPQAGGITFVRLKGCPIGSKVVLKSMGVFSRLFL